MSGVVAMDDLHLLALQRFGYKGQLAALAEEAAELAAAACRLLNGKCDEFAVVEEIIGVEAVVASIRDELADEGVWDLIRAEQRTKLCMKLVEGGAPDA